MTRTGATAASRTGADAPDEGEGSLGSYYLDAFISGVLEPARCATFVLLMWGTAGTNPHIGTGTLVSCGTLFTWEDGS